MTAARIAGVDEVGRGPLAGPVLACAVILREIPEGLADSKVLGAARREALAETVLGCAWVGLGAASVAEIDRIDILRASLLAMRRAVQHLPVRPERVLVDGRHAPDLDLPVECVIGGDAKVPAISAASILAKVVRDRLMARLGARYPGYGFERHAGYPTAAHREALRRLGPCPHHRRSFAPVRAVVEGTGAVEFSRAPASPPRKRPGP